MVTDNKKAGHDMDAQYPKVYWCRACGDDTYHARGDLVATHKVVPLDAVVIEKDAPSIVISYTGSTNSLTGHPSPQCYPMYPVPGRYILIEGEES